MSEELLVKTGVPQGSILGPLLFIIYINDIVHSVSNANLCLFADDTSLVVNEKCGKQAEINAFLLSNSMLQWFDKNQLLVNTEKSSLINFKMSSVKNSDFGLFIGDDVVNSVRLVKFLGIIIDRNLKYYSHVNVVAGKLSSGLFVLRRLSSFTDTDVLLMAYYALIYPHMSYAVCIWGHESSYTKQIFLLQKKAIRIIAHLRQRETCKNLFKKFNILTFPCIYIYHTLLFLKQNTHLFNRFLPVSQYSIRNKNNFNIPNHKTSFFKNQSSYNTIILFNALPNHLKSIIHDTTFKRKLKEFLVNKAYYSVNDYINNR